VLAVEVCDPDVARAIQLGDEEELLAVGRDGRVVLVLGALGELPLARAVGGDDPDVARRDAALLLLLAPRVEDEVRAVGGPGRHGARAGGHDGARAAVLGEARRGGGEAEHAERDQDPPRHVGTLIGSRRICNTRARRLGETGPWRRDSFPGRPRECGAGGATTSPTCRPSSGERAAIAPSGSTTA